MTRPSCQSDRATLIKLLTESARRAPAGGRCSRVARPVFPVPVLRGDGKKRQEQFAERHGRASVRPRQCDDGCRRRVYLIFAVRTPYALSVGALDSDPRVVPQHASLWSLWNRSSERLRCTERSRLLQKSQLGNPTTARQPSRAPNSVSPHSAWRRLRRERARANSVSL